MNAFLQEKQSLLVKGNQVYADNDEPLDTDDAFHKQNERFIFLISFYEDK